VANTLRLLQLHAQIQEMVRSGRLSMGHAKVLLGVEDEERQRALAERAVSQGLSVRHLEGLTRPEAAAGGKGKPRAKRTLPADLLAVERRLREQFGTPVRLQINGERGRLEITFFGQEGLSRLLDALGMAGEGKPRPPREPFRV
jgi:ParB family chromosome partitioning protein